MDLQLFPHIEFRLSLRDNSDFHSLKYKVESHSSLNSSRVLISFDDGSFQNHNFFAAYLAPYVAPGFPVQVSFSCTLVGNLMMSTALMTIEEDATSSTATIF